MQFKKSFFALGISLFLGTNLYADAQSVLVRRGREVLITSTKPAEGIVSATAHSIKYQTASLDSGASINAFSNQAITVSQRSIDRYCKKVMRHDPSAICEANVVFKTSLTPNDSDYSELWGMEKISAPNAWGNFSTGSRNIKVAVVDSGIDYTHPDLEDNLGINTNEIEDNGIDDDNNGYVDDYYGYNFSDSNGDPMDDNDHGTHVSGTLGAVGNNEEGVSGVNWSTSILTAKALNSEGEGTLDAVAAGIDYVVGRGADVINLSIGSSSGSRTLRNSIINAKFSDVLVVAAAGNESANNERVFSFPASFDLSNIIGVAASDPFDEIADFSNYGSTVHLAAPGTDIFSTIPGGGYDYLSGTSMASPHVAGAAGLIKAFKPELSALDLKDIILNSVDSKSSLELSVKTGGRLNVSNAMSLAAQTSPHGPPTAGSSQVTLTVKKGKSKVKHTNVITGTLSDSEGAFVGEKVSLFCNNKRKAVQTTDKAGKFSLSVKTNGKMNCQVKDAFGTASKRFSIA